jgi:hypothetical protein
MLIFRSALALILGYFVLVLASTVVQETIFHGVSYQRSSLSVLIGAGLLTPLSGVLAGLVTSAVAGRAFFLHVIPICIWICGETTVLYLRGIVDGPLWFEGGAGLALILGCAAGAAIWQRTRSVRQTGPVHS